MEQKIFKILVINPGSTSTKIALYENENLIKEVNVFHDAPLLLSFPTVNDQLPYRKKVILDYLKENHFHLEEIDAFVGRGGNSYSLESGTYLVTDLLVEHTKEARGGSDHPSNLGVQLADEFAKEYGKVAYTVDPVVVDELSDLARITGIKDVYRQARFHVLNQKGMAKQYAKDINKKYEDLNLIVCHIDGGITICAHQKGKMVDGNDGAGGDGPYTPTRIGSISVNDMLFYIEGKDLNEVKKLMTRSGGFMSHFGTSNSDTIYQMIQSGDKQAKLIFDAMIYQICKAIGQMAVVLEGNVDAIVIGGGLVRFKEIEQQIQKRCGFIAPLKVYKEEFEHISLCKGALAVLRNEQQPKIYKGIPVFLGF